MEVEFAQLEDRVRRVVERLKSTASERDRLQEELRRLEQQLKAAGARSAAAKADSRPERLPAALIDSLRDAIRELREV